MRATHRIIACALCLALIGTAAAASLDAPGVDHAAQTTSDRLAHDSNTIVGDSLGQSRENSVTNRGDDAAGTSRNGNDRSGAASSAPAPAPRPHLGWQSLLPGSIQ